MTRLPYRPVLALSAVMLAVALVSARSMRAQQVSDTAFVPRVSPPAYQQGRGPRLCIDEAHHNFHTMGGRFAPFAELARRDGFVLRPIASASTSASLSNCDVLVIANAQPSAAPWREYPYPTPSAFSSAEITALHAWVERGGRLLLIADHMPLAGAAKALAAAFGAEFTDGFAMRRAPAGASQRQIDSLRALPTLFRRGDGTLASHPTTEGGDATRITQLRSFTGQAFRWEAPDVMPVLVLPQDYESLEPRVAWEFTRETPVRDVGGWLQGATRQVGAGRVALFGEAAMFTAQLAGPRQTPMGMNAPLAEQNAQFVLNTLAWLAAGPAPLALPYP